MSRMKKLGFFFIDLASKLLDILLFLFLLALLFLGTYLYLDQKWVVELADNANYQAYRPKESPISFDRLREKNPEVKAWLHLYGSSVDYPVAQAKDNVKYLNQDVFGNFSLAGSLFLDARNKADFTDFSHVIYGHHMAERAMFGDIAKYADSDYFEAHPHGSLHVDGRDYGLEIFAFVSGSLQKPELFEPQERNGEKNKHLLEGIKANAVCYRTLDFSEKDRIVILYTCGLKHQDARDLLFARLIGRVPTNPYKEVDSAPKKAPLSEKKGDMAWILFGSVSTLLLLIGLYKALEKRNRRKEGEWKS